MINTHECFQFSEIRTTADSVTAHWIVPQDLPYLQGHFPGQPIVPAVAMFDATLELLNKTLRPNAQLEQVKNAKFTKPLEPLQKVTIDCKRVADQEWNADWKVEGEIVAKLYFAT